MHAGTAQVHDPTSEPRFGFGDNWRRFLGIVDEDRIQQAAISLKTLLEQDSLVGLRFLDVGSGSGLFSLAAHRLGAERVRSMDVDPDSVTCTTYLRDSAGAPASWTVEQASVLDRQYMLSLGEFDVVYSWGVLHHTGDMYAALENIVPAVAPGGRLCIAIYNDLGAVSRRWLRVKRFYLRLPAWARTPYVALMMAPRELRGLVSALARGRPLDYVRLWTTHRNQRGMSRWTDMVDWVGGYPFEVASPTAIFDFYRARGFKLVRLLTRPGQNEYVFERPADA